MQKYQLKPQNNIWKRIINRKKIVIIAEAGVNHNGSLRLAKKMALAAKSAGADAVKFQTFKTEELVSLNAPMAKYQENNLKRRSTQFQMLKKLELRYGDFEILKRYCDGLKIIFLSTPHTDDAVKFLDTIVPIFKIASGDLTNIPLLINIAAKKKPIIIGTGMADQKEIAAAIKAIMGGGNNKIVLLHCTTSYPCPLNEVNLLAMATLKKRFKLPVGYSDHTSGIIVPIMAASMGAAVIEKHFTLDKSLPGPDHKSSLSPKELKEMIDAIRNVEKAMGNGIKQPTASEKIIKKIARKSIVAKVNIKKGIRINRQMLTIKRPGTGIEPSQISKVVGKIIKRNVKQDHLLNWKDI